ncbi:hypothetical protein [Nocardia jiangxiensis]|uniref:hypothetical protein n=1 Tax=Nocardia jiangxiensis TaxID=282685 RepID=UPI0002F160FC|nr:hypothetical protein [Nocardia jiangxiensis]
MDSLYADVSSWQIPVDDTYPYQIFCFRANDGVYEDPNFAQNYRWAVNAVESGKLSCFIVYSFWRSNWQATGQTAINMIEAQGGPHPKLVMMIDLESGGNPGGDQSDGVNKMYWQWTDWLGTTNDIGTRRVIGYANANDFYSMWRTRPDGLRMVGAGYGTNPNLPGQIAHQFTDGVYSSAYKRILHNHADNKLAALLGGSLPTWCPPFGFCDMNSADGLSPSDFAAACGIGETDMTPAQAQMLQEIWDQLRGINGAGWTQLGGLTPVDAIGEVRDQLSGPNHQYGGWPQLNGRTVVDALAEIGQKLGMPGYQPPTPPAHS